MIDTRHIYISKAAESMAGAESEYANGRYDNCASRCYYACFQAGVHALLVAGLSPTGPRTTWGHEQLQAMLVGQLINRRNLYAAELRDVLPRTLALRHTADYSRDRVSELQAARALRRARRFLSAIQERGGAS
jgi:uncharacterized protein (UPF0332 family)